MGRWRHEAIPVVDGSGGDRGMCVSRCRVSYSGEEVNGRNWKPNTWRLAVADRGEPGFDGFPC